LKEKFKEIDERISSYFASQNNPFLFSIFSIVAYLGSGWVCLTVYLFLLTIFTVPVRDSVFGCSLRNLQA
jgi:hypothetical protein